MSIGKIEVTGLRDFQKQLRAMDAGLPRQIRLVLNEAADIIVDWDMAHMPKRSGRARASVKSRSTQRQAQVAIGGNRAPYVPWLDFGGQGKRPARPPKRPFIKDGRYTYQGLKMRRNDILEVMQRGLVALATGAGAEVSDG